MYEFTGKNSFLPLSNLLNASAAAASNNVTCFSNSSAEVDANEGHWQQGDR